MSKRKLHSGNKVSRPKSAKEILVLLVMVLVCAAAIGSLFAYKKLRDCWIEQCVIDDPQLQVLVESTGKMIKAETIREGFDLHRKGANLWTTDFAVKRKEMLDKYHTIRDITITKRLPSKVTIFVTEREPIARINLQGAKQESFLVADSEGVAFKYARNTGALPVIRVPSSPGLPKSGERMTGNMLAALRLIEAAQEPEFQELGILEIYTGKTDFLWTTLGNYQRAKIAWEGMEAPSDATRENMVRTLRNLRDAINARLTGNNVIWNATESGKIYADTKEPIK